MCGLNCQTTQHFTIPRAPKQKKDDTRSQHHLCCPTFSVFLFSSFLNRTTNTHTTQISQQTPTLQRANVCFLHPVYSWVSLPVSRSCSNLFRRRTKHVKMCVQGLAVFAMHVKIWMCVLVSDRDLESNFRNDHFLLRW